MTEAAAEVEAERPEDEAGHRVEAAAAEEGSEVSLTRHSQLFNPSHRSAHPRILSPLRDS